MKVYNDLTLSGDEVKALHTMCQMARDLKLDGHIEEYSQITSSMKNQLKMLKKTIELAETDISANYTDDEIRYMKRKYR